VLTLVQESWIEHSDKLFEYPGSQIHSWANSELGVPARTTQLRLDLLVKINP